MQIASPLLEDAGESPEEIAGKSIDWPLAALANAQTCSTRTVSSSALLDFGFADVAQ